MEVNGGSSYSLIQILKSTDACHLQMIGRNYSAYRPSQRMGRGFGACGGRFAPATRPKPPFPAAVGGGLSSYDWTMVGSVPRDLEYENGRVVSSVMGGQ